MATESDEAGGSVRFLHGEESIRLTMELTYEGLTRAEATTLRDHYRDQQGAHIDFQLPAVIWAGHSSVDNIVPAGQHWRYGAEPEEDHVTGGTLVNVSITLVTAKCPSTGFDPLTLSPGAWWDASDASSITTSGTAVTEWRDKSGNGHHWTQTTSGYRPTYTTAAVNGLNAVTWPTIGNTRHMRATVTGFSAAEMYFVVKFGNANFASYEGLINVYNSGLDGWFTGGSSSDSLFFTATNVYINGNNTTNRNTDLFPEMQNGCLLRLTAASPFATTELVLGTDRTFHDLNRSWKEFICEGLCFPTALGTDERTNIETYMMGKWGIA